MKLHSQIKSLTRSFRVKLSRWLSTHDLTISDALSREQDRLVLRVQELSDRVDVAEEGQRQAEQRYRQADQCHRQADLRHRQAEERYAASEASRLETVRQFEHAKQTTIERMCQLLQEKKIVLTETAAATAVNLVIEQLVRPFHKSASWGDRLLTLDKSLGFAKDPAFEEAFATFRGLQPYDQYNGEHSIAWRLNTLVWAAREVVGLDGDFVECGVFKGDMAYTIAKCLGFESIRKTFYLYDSFEGFSPKYTSLADFPYNPPFLDIANKAYRIPGLYETVCARFAEYPNFKITQGFLPDTLSTVCPEKIAFLHVDLNSPAAEVGTLEVLFDRVVPSGIILLDDYGWIDFAPQKEAEDAFFGSRGYRVLELPTGQGMVVKR